MTVTIIGGGISGSTLALALSHLTHGQLNIDLVESMEPEYRYRSSLDTRSIVLSISSCYDLNMIGVWKTLVSCVNSITKIEVIDQRNFGKITFLANKYKIPAFGYVSKIHNINSRLFTLLKQTSGVRLHCPSKFISIKRKKNHSVITLTNGKKLNSKLIVAADGSNSTLASQYGIKWKKKDYQQIAVISNIRTTVSHNNIAFEIFTSSGSLALLPMPDGSISLIWCVQTEKYSEISHCNDIRFCEELQKELGWRLGKITYLGKRQCYPLKLCISERHISHRLALVGNAAQTIHPIAGQGLNIGLRDVITLAETIVQAYKKNEDIGDYKVLSCYQKRRRPDQDNIVKITDGLINLFSNNHLPLILIRNLGMLAIDNIPLIRDVFLRKTLGYVIR